MARSPHSLAGGHVLMWSSPLLLLVLLFTVTTHSTPTTATTRPTAPLATSTSTSTTTTTTTPTPPTTTTTSVPRSTLATASSARPTASSGGPTASAGAPSGALSGTLGPGLDAVAVPLAGPGAWTLVAGAGVRATLSCPSGSGAVVRDVVIPVRETCQLLLSVGGTSEAESWRLAPGG